MEKVMNIYQRINQVMKQVKYIQKDAKGGLKYSVVSHDAVSAALHDVITDAGIVVDHEVEGYGLADGITLMVVRVDFINMDDGQDKMTVRYRMPVMPASGRQDEKCFGGALSYALKYVMLKTFMLETGEDADVAYLTNDQIKTIMELIGSDSDRVSKLLDFFNARSLKEVPSDCYERIIQTIQKKSVKSSKVDPLREEVI